MGERLTIATDLASFATCPTLSDPLDGAVDTSAGTTSGDQAIYSCNTGYTLSGTSAITCGSDGNWNNSAPTCTPVDCGSLSNITDGTVLYTLTTYSSQATYNCNTGYTINGLTVTTCGSDGNWDNLAPTCTPVDCGSLSNITYGTVSNTLTTYGYQATYNCNTGYAINGSTVRTCGSDGNWDNSIPACLPVDCGSLSNITYGTVSYTLTTYGSQATYNCSTGYTINGSTVTTCGSDGNWDNLTPTCTPVDCGSLFNVTDGTVSYNSSTYGSQAIYICNTGYTLNGSAVRTCGVDENWDNSAPTCTAIDCGSPTDPAFGFVSYMESTYGAMANYTCDVGYILTGPNSTMCLLNGTWNSVGPECAPADCGSLTDPVHGSVHTPAGTTFNSKATFSCDAGYVLSHGAPRICQAQSVWSGTSPTCNQSGVTSTSAPPARILYIMPCICYPNNTFVNMTQEEIVQQLIADIKIDTKSTTLAQYKLKSRSDPRMSSKMIGVVAVAILSVIGGLILFCDILSILASFRSSGD